MPSQETPAGDFDPALYGATLEIDLAALRANYRRILKELDGVPSAVVCKADGYGLGAARVARAFWDAGARIFFVAQPTEAIRLRDALPLDADIHVLNGLMPGTERAFRDNRLVPVLNSLGQIERWRAFCRERETPLPCDIHVDTGMLRLGLPPDELARVEADPALVEGLDVRCVISHLACADLIDDPKNAEQLAAFRHARRVLPMGLGCFANSSGVFLGPDYRFELGRPGVALYGVNPRPEGPNPMQPVVRLTARILQVRRVDAPESVGYGASYRVENPGRIATIPVGYADGYLRSISNRGHAMLAGRRVPVVGRVSMDLVTLDVSQVPEAEAQPGAEVELLGTHVTADDVAAAAGTIGYEILTSLGARYRRVYIGD